MIVLIKYTDISSSEYQKSYILNFTIRVNSSNEIKIEREGEAACPKTTRARTHALDRKKIILIWY